jgi:hypothetical protein|tara:strand:+ start:13318 stop:13422 length:105 start_codon:yes stop_codon:yes gene_type:complete
LPLAAPVAGLPVLLPFAGKPLPLFWRAVFYLFEK